MHCLVSMKHDATILENILVFYQLKYIFILNDLVIHFLGIFPKEIVIQLPMGIYTRIIIIALFARVGFIWRSVSGKVDM